MLETLVGFALGLIPLLITQWFDLQKKRDAYREELYRTQFVAYQEIYSKLLRLLSKSRSAACYLDVKDTPDETIRFTAHSLVKHHLDLYTEFHDSLERHALVLPNDVTMQLGTCETLFRRLQRWRMDLSPDRPSAKEIEQDCNAALNLIRVRCGVMRLSDEVLKQIAPIGDFEVLSITPGKP